MEWDRETAPQEAIIGIPLVEGGYKLAPYNDGFGYWTIGCGSRTLPNGKPVTGLSPPLTLDQAHALFAVELKPRLVAIHNAIPQPLTTGQVAALASWVFECGAGVLSTSLVAPMIAGNRYDLALNHMAEYCEARNQATHVLEPQLGIMRRRKFEALMWNGMEPNQAYAQAWTSSYTDGMAAYNAAMMQEKAWRADPASVPVVATPVVVNKPATPAPVNSPSFLSGIAAFFASIF